MLLPFLVFSVSSILSPGPANIAASAFGQERGYRRTIRFLSGMALCFGAAMAVFGFAAESLRDLVPALSPYLRWAGAAYMAWLAVSLFLPAKGGAAGRPREPGFCQGLLMILANPKLYAFAAALFASFGAGLAGKPASILLVSVVLGALQFASASVWTLLGVAFSLALGRPGFKKAFTAVMAGLLGFSAVLTALG